MSISQVPDGGDLSVARIDGLQDAVNQLLAQPGGGLSADYEAALGKVTASGYNSRPTLFDPASTGWNDGSFFQVDYATGRITWRSELADQTTPSFEIQDPAWPIFQVIPGWNGYNAGFFLRGGDTDPSTGAGRIEFDVEHDLSFHSGRMVIFADPPIGDPVQWLFEAGIQNDASGAYSTFRISDAGTRFQFASDRDLGTAKLELHGHAGQTTILFDLEAGMFAITPDGKVGGVAPNVGDSIKWDGTKWAAAA